MTNLYTFTDALTALYARIDDIIEQFEKGYGTKYPSPSHDARVAMLALRDTMPEVIDEMRHLEAKQNMTSIHMFEG